MTLEAQTDRLYGLPLEQFTRERNQAAREARQAGSREEAEAIAKLPKPTLAVWAINQLVRHEPREIDLLLETGKTLLDAQRASLEGDRRDELDRVRSSFDTSIAELAASAGRMLERRPTDATLARIEETLRAAAVSSEGRERLARGTLREEMRSTGWDLLEGLAANIQPSASRAAPSTGAPARTSRARIRTEHKAAREGEKAAREHRRDAARALRSLERDQARAQRELDVIGARLEKARRVLAEAEEDLAAAREELPSRS